MKTTLAYALVMLAVGPALSDESVTYHRFGHDTFGSDGSRTHEFAGDQHITDKDGHRTVCHEFAGNTTCRDE